MKISLLGISGGELGLGHHSISFLVDDELLIDAGGLLHAMDLESLLKIDTLLVSHSHIDHVKDMLLWGDLIFGMRKPIQTYGATDTLDAVKKHLFNWVIWPDFSAIPTPEAPIFKFNRFTRGDSFEEGKYKVQTVEVNHTVPSSAFIVEKDGSSFVYSSDTTTTDKLWEEVNKKENLKAIFLEISFPNKMQAVADMSKHYSPATLAEDLKKIKVDVPIYLYHIKPSYYDDVVKEVEALGDSRVRIAKTGEIVEI